MRTIDGHFTVVNEPGTATELAKNLLARFESVRAPEHIIITETILEQGALRAQGVLSNSLEQSIKKIENQIEAIPVPTEKIEYPKIEKAQLQVLEATNRAEKLSSKKNWRKLDKCRKELAKQCEKAGFESYTKYVDFLNAQGVGGTQRRELLIARDELIAKRNEALKKDKSLTSLTPAQIITVLADVLSRCPHTPVGPLPIVFDDALRNVETSTKLRALEVLKAHASHYATWYVTDDPLVLGWAGFIEDFLNLDESQKTAIFDIDQQAAS